MEVVNDGYRVYVAKVEAFGQEAKVIALGDGEFRLRCMSKNGTDKTKLISELNSRRWYRHGLQEPYEFISAGLYDYGKGEVGNGNEKEWPKSGWGDSSRFSDLDFGPDGSDTITIPIFALSSEEYPCRSGKGCLMNRKPAI